MAVDLPEIDEVEIQSDEVKDTRDTAVQMAFIGAGQGGCNLADAFYGLGYRRVVAINTTAKDLQRLTIPETNRLVMSGADEGAGKNPEAGAKIFSLNREDILSKCQNVFRKGVEQIMICAGAGGGTGTGCALGLIEMATTLLAAQNVATPEKKVGVIVTLPTREESAAVQANAHELLVQLIELAKRGKLSPLVIVDNARVMKMFGHAAVTNVWAKANKNIAALFDVFNTIPSVSDESCHVTFDPADYRTILSGGIMTFGRTKLPEATGPSAISDAIRANVKKGLLVEGMDLSQATAGVGILVADQENLEKISQEALENAFGSLNRLMKQSSETKLHRGVYSTTAQGVYLYTMLSGLGAPADRMKEMATKAQK